MNTEGCYRDISESTHRKYQKIEELNKRLEIFEILTKAVESERIEIKKNLEKKREELDEKEKEELELAKEEVRRLLCSYYFPHIGVIEKNERVGELQKKYCIILPSNMELFGTGTDESREESLKEKIEGYIYNNIKGYEKIMEIAIKEKKFDEASEFAHNIADCVKIGLIEYGIKGGMIKDAEKLFKLMIKYYEKAIELCNLGVNDRMKSKAF